MPPFFGPFPHMTAETAPCESHRPFHCDTQEINSPTFMFCYTQQPTGGRIFATCRWSNGLPVPSRNVLPDGVFLPVRVRSGDVQPFRGDGGVPRLLAGQDLPGKYDHARGVPGIPLLSSRLGGRDYLSDRHVWRKGEGMNRS